MTGGAAANIGRMIHPPIEKCNRIGMASFAGLHRWKVIRRFAQNAQRLTIVAVCTIADYADMVITFYQKSGVTSMTSITLTVGR
jgi:tryptophan 2,3-dioxygenase